MSRLSTKRKSSVKPLLPHTMPYDTSPLIPLSFDRVVGNEPITSSLPIFQLPVELLTHILPYLTPIDIRNLALVDRDANQLARSVQFAHVKLDYSSQSLELLAKLIAEATISEPHSRRHIGQCIRQLTVSTTRHHFIQREGIDLEELEELDLDERYHRIEAAKRTELHYLQSICNLLSNLPNLFILDWDDKVALTSEMVQAFVSSSISHLRLNGPILTTEFGTPTPKDSQSWALESLYLNVGWSMTTTTPGSTFRFVSSLLRLTAPTLQRLVWVGQADSFARPCHYFDEDAIFPSLREVALNLVGFKDSSWFERVFGKNTLVYSFSTDANLLTSTFLANRGRVSSLKHFKWTYSPSIQYDDMTKFIHANSQLSCLEVTCGLPCPSINSLLTQQNQYVFDNLTALHLISSMPTFDEDTLKIIASVRSLEHLWLTAGSQHGWRYEWNINHDYMMDVLQPLTQLRTIAFTRDAYVVQGHPLLDNSVERYYISKVLPHNLLLDQYLTEDEIKNSNTIHDATFDNAMRLQASLRALTWERWHQSQMVMFATEYSRVFRNLEWCFIGQLPMHVEDNMFWRIAELDSEDRDPCLLTLVSRWEQMVQSL